MVETIFYSVFNMRGGGLTIIDRGDLSLFECGHHECLIVLCFSDQGFLVLVLKLSLSEELLIAKAT